MDETAVMTLQSPWTEFVPAAQAREQDVGEEQAMITAFVGLPVPRDVADVLEKAQGGLHAGELVPKACFFVSVVELGVVPEAVIDDIRRALADVRVGPFYMNVSGVNTQGVNSPGDNTQGGNAPRVVYAGTDTTNGLKTLYTQVTRLVRKAGLPLDPGRVAPSITIAEFDELGPGDLRQIMSFLSRREALRAGPFPVTDFSLIVMREDPAGLVQEVLETYPLSL
jgi:2'-5' RNA ligase